MAEVLVWAGSQPSVSRHLPLIITAVLLASFIVGLFLTTWVSDFRLARIPFLVCCLSIHLMLILIVGASRWLVLTEQQADMQSMLVWQLGFFMFALCLLGAVSAARSRDAIGGTASGMLFFLPLVNLWLLLCRTGQPMTLPSSGLQRQISGINGVRFVVILLVMNLAANIWLEKRTVQWTARAADLKAETARAAAEAAAKADADALPGDVVAFAAAVPVPFRLTDDFTFSEVVASGRNLFIRLDTSAWFEHAEADSIYYTPVFCGFAEMPDLLARGARVIVSIHDPDGARAIDFSYDGSACDS